MNQRGFVPLQLIFAIIAALVLAAFAWAALGPSEDLEPAGDRFSRICDVQVYNGFLRESKIMGQDCRTGNRCYLSLPDSPLALFSDDVRVKLEVGGDVAQSPLFNLDEGKTYAVQVKACSASALGQLSLLDEKGQHLGDAVGVNFA